MGPLILAKGPLLPSDDGPKADPRRSLLYNSPA